MKTTDQKQLCTSANIKRPEELDLGNQTCDPIRDVDRIHIHLFSIA
jgi:hypothetical protein